MTPARSALLPLVLTLGAASAAGCGALSGPPPRPVILVTVDTLRADRVGLHGFAFPTPALDAFGREGAWASTAYAPFPRTTQSVGSILTGLHPLQHGGDGLGMRLPESATTLAERFRERGYDTAAFITNIVLQPGFGFEQGFELFSNPEPRWVGDSAFALTGEAVAWLRSRPKDGKPFFLWVHYLDPHWSYEPRPEFARRTDPSGTGAGDLAQRVESGAVPWGRLLFDAPSVLTPAEIEQARRMYDAEVLQTDAAVGQLVAALKELGYWDGAVLAFASDHGESLGEHDYWFGHGEYLYDTTLHVPLMLRAAGQIPPGTRIDGVVRRRGPGADDPRALRRAGPGRARRRGPRAGPAPGRDGRLAARDRGAPHRPPADPRREPAPPGGRPRRALVGAARRRAEADPDPERAGCVGRGALRRRDRPGRDDEPRRQPGG